MARITVEDCLRRIDNRFELVLMATRRARQLERGAAATVPEDGDKPAVVALREIADNTIDTATIDAIEREYQEQEARRAIEWAASEWREDDDSDEDRAPTRAEASAPAPQPSATGGTRPAPVAPAANADQARPRRAA